MPVYHCCVPGCTSSTRKMANLEKYPSMKNVKFFSLPPKSKPTKRNLWIRMIRRENTWLPNKYTRICSLHFDGDTATPTLFPYNNFKESLHKRTTMNSSTVTDVHKEEEDEDTSTLDISAEPVLYEFYNSTSVPYITGEVECSCENYDELGVKLERDNTIRCPPTTDHIYYTTSNQHAHDTADASTCTESWVQTDMTMLDIANLEEDNRCLLAKLGDKDTLLREFFVEKVTKNDKNVRMYTGLPSLTLLLGIFNILMSNCSTLKYWSGQASAEEKAYQNSNKRKPGPSRKLSPFHEFVLTLVRLRLGLFEFFIADIFGVSKSRTSQIFTTWITFMSSVFGELIKWPSRSQVKKRMPQSFKRHYPNTRTIIDCTEFFFQKPRSPTAQAATYSTYKSSNTGKCLLGISPSETFTFVSDIYGGNVSDRYITQNSGFLDLIEEGDDVMADRGFTVRDLLTDKKATLNIPPFTRKCSWGKSKRLNIAEIKQTRKIAKLRIHVERAIQRLKLFRLIGRIIPWSLKPLMNQMVKVSAFLCNLMPTLVKK